MAPSLRTRTPKAAAPTVLAPAKAAPKPFAKAAAKPKATTSAKAAATGATKAKAATAAAKTGKMAAAAAKPVTKAAASKPVSKSKAAPKTASKPASITKPTPTSSPVIDHTAFPHIFNLILAYAPHAALLALRPTSSALKDRCDSLLAQHILLGPGISPARLKNAAYKRAVAVGALPAGPAKKRQLQYRINAAAIDGSLPGWACDWNHGETGDDTCGALCTKLRAYWLDKLAETKVVDIHPWRAAHFERLKDALPGLETLRVYPHDIEHTQLVAPTVVVFNSLVDKDNWHRVTSSRSIFADPAMRRYVAHTIYDTDRPMLSDCWTSLPTLFSDCLLEEIVLHFAPAPGTKNESNPAWGAGDYRRQNGVLWDVANHLRVGSNATYRVVGIDTVPVEMFGVWDGVKRTRAELEEAIYKNIVDWILDDNLGKSKWTDEREGEIRRNLSFYTADEYGEHVGVEQYKLETERLTFEGWD